MPNGTNENDKCKLHRFEKNNYFYGKLMTVRDFETEQSYFDEKRHLINRLLHGSGLVCGFENLKIEFKDNKITIDFVDGGMALDCCGREIAVPANTLGKDVINSSGSTVSTLPDGSFLYLKYKPCYEGYVAAASNPSSCDERCCPGRVIEGFEVVVSNEAPDSMGIRCRAESSEDPNVIPDASEWLKNLEEEHKQCSLCGENQGSKVFLVSADSDLVIKREDTEKYRIFFTEKELYQLLKCHILDFNNPHGVTASQTGALVSVDGVSNPGGNVDLSPQNAIIITPDDTGNLITIGETHSARKDNPHEVTATQTGALVSVSGVSNPGGNIDLTAGINITITPDLAANTIEIASTGGGGIPATTVESVGVSRIVGTSGKYSREDHVHDLDKGIVEIENLSRKLQSQLETVFMYLRERALKCTVTSFKEIWDKFEATGSADFSDAMNNAKDIYDTLMNPRINPEIYIKPNNFYNFIKDNLHPLLEKFLESIQQITTPSPIFLTSDNVDNYEKILKELRAELVNLETNNDEENILKLAPLMDEVCFYVLRLDIKRG